jgi:hypothetical protein
VKPSHVLVIGSVVSILCSVGLISALAQSDSAPPRAKFNDDGTVNVPLGYRNWTHVGTRLKATGINILDGLPTKHPEILSTYVEPAAMTALEKSGQWPDGTQIVKEFSSVRFGDDCDDKTAYCNGSLGSGIFEAGYVGLGLMVKDAKRFPNATGHWGYFSFGHRPPPYDKTATVRDKQQCESCHINLASDTDYVISRAHIGLTGRVEKDR